MGVLAQLRPTVQVTSPIKSPKTTLENLPVDMKFEILRQMSSFHDVESTFLCCRSYFTLAKSPALRTQIELEVIPRELGLEGEALMKIRSFKSGKTKDELRIALPDPLDDLVPKTRNLFHEQLTSLRASVRYFTRLFFREMFARRLRGPDTFNPRYVDQSNVTRMMKTLSGDEWARVDRAIYTIWLFSELNYDMPGRSQQHCEAINKWTIADENLNLLISPDLAVLYVVQRIIIRLLRPMVRDYTYYADPDEMEIMPSLAGSLCHYHNQGIPNKLVDQLGFDKLKGLLKATDWEQREIVGEIWRRPIDRRNDSPRPHPSELNGVHGFDRILTAYWRYPGKGHHNEMRSLWKSPMGKYITRAAPWNQSEGFDVYAAVWDEKRLKKWNYWPAARNDESKLIHDLCLEDKAMLYSCNGPHDEWKCDRYWS